MRWRERRWESCGSPRQSCASSFCFDFYLNDAYSDLLPCSYRGDLHLRLLEELPDVRYAGSASCTASASLTRFDRHSSASTMLLLFRKGECVPVKASCKSANAFSFLQD